MPCRSSLLLSVSSLFCVYVSAPLRVLLTLMHPCPSCVTELERLLLYVGIVTFLCCYTHARYIPALMGTVLGPVLFLVYINDLPCSISGDCSIFADDTLVYNTDSKPPSICSMLSKDLNYAADWAAEWGVLFNAEKKEHLAISARKSDITSPHVTMNGTQIPQVTSHKHLGVNFNNTLSWQQHVATKFTHHCPALEE